MQEPSTNSVRHPVVFERQEGPPLVVALGMISLYINLSALRIMVLCSKLRQGRGRQEKRTAWRASSINRKEGRIVMSQNSPHPAGGGPSKISPSAPARLAATRQKDAHCVLLGDRFNRCLKFRVNYTVSGVSSDVAQERTVAGWPPPSRTNTVALPCAAVLL